MEQMQQFTATKQGSICRKTEASAALTLPAHMQQSYSTYCQQLRTWPTVLNVNCLLAWASRSKGVCSTISSACSPCCFYLCCSCTPRLQRLQLLGIDPSFVLAQGTRQLACKWPALAGPSLQHEQPRLGRLPLLTLHTAMPGFPAYAL
jgi:hypothetical protein